jgi:hypothetical protein
VLSTRPIKVAEVVAVTAAEPTRDTPVPAVSVTVFGKLPRFTITISKVEPTLSPDIAVKISAAVAVVNARAAVGVILNNRLEII